METNTGARLLAATARLNRWASRNAAMPIPPAQGRLLGLIEQMGPARIGTLASADHCSQPTMTTQVQRLERAGLVERQADEHDGRASVVQLSDAGRRMLAGVRDARMRVVAPVFEAATDDQRAELERAADAIEQLLALAERGPEAGRSQ